MKLRIYRNQLRFRFDREEMERLNCGESLESSIQVGPSAAQRLTYSVLTAGGDAVPRARLEGQSIIVTLGRDVVKKWCEGNELALESEETWEGYTLKLLLEKDMKRLNPKPGDESPSAYPNPLSGKARCDHP